ncbi:ABC transporter permease [Candidatus Saccharibacteria bacterium]|nr:ABC transporter permease [Candidatus Saccharibacteria bacterium]
MRLLIGNHLKNAMDTLSANRMRSLLTVLGIAIGVTSVVMVLALSGGVQMLVEEQIETAGGNIIVVRPETGRGVGDRNVFAQIATTQTHVGSSLTEIDVEVIRKLDGVDFVSPLAIVEVNLRGEHEVEAVTVVGVTSDLNDIVQFPMRDGHFLDSELTGRTAVIGHSLALDLFGTASDAIGRTVGVRDEVFVVVGLISELNEPINYNNVDFDNAMIVSMGHAREMWPNLQIQQISVRTENRESLSGIAREITDRMMESRYDQRDFSVRYGADIGHPAEDLISIVSTMLAMVAGVSLVVGGIGVMNIMLVSVAERTHEIGIKKAVGATNGHVLMQFLFEALILSLLGGLLGLLFGYAFAFGASLFTPFRPVITGEILMVAGLIAVAIGAVFGCYPALKASRKNPIESLRHYR